MIIKLLATKDTYVSSLKTKFNDGTLANVGQASTIDIFKVISSHKDIKAQALMEFSSNPDVNSTFRLIDAAGNDLTYTFISGASNGNNIQIANSITNTIDEVINVINSVGDSLKITAYKASSSSLIFEQDTAGSLGKTSTSISNHNDKYSLTNFKQFEHSAGLISFPITTFKSKNVNTYSSSVFNNSSNFKAVIKLVDVGSSSTRPKDFNLNINVLSKSFEEGLGKDTLHFSDIGTANFQKINQKLNLEWENQNTVLLSDLIVNSDFDTQNFDVILGNENVKFDITNHIKFTLNQSQQKEDFVLSVSKTNLFDEYDYFVKRLGSSQVRNKIKKPTLEIKIKDSLVGYFNNKNKKRFLDNEEVFYLKNIIDNKLTQFLDSDSIKLKIEFLDSSSTDVLNLAPIIAGESNKVYDYTGKEIVGIKKFTINKNTLTRLNSNFASEINKNAYVSIKLKYFYNAENIIKEETVRFYLPDTNSNVLSSNIRSSINLQQKNLVAKNNLEFVKISFIDIDKQYDTVKIPLALTTENLGDVFYSMYDVDTGEDIIEFVEEDKEYTRLIYNGDSYILNLYCSEQYKNKRVSFVFYYDDINSGTRSIIEDKDLIVRFK